MNPSKEHQNLKSDIKTNRTIKTNHTVELVPANPLNNSTPHMLLSFAQNSPFSSKPYQDITPHLGGCQDQPQNWDNDNRHCKETDTDANG